jgi:hypothetical protein
VNPVGYLSPYPTARSTPTWVSQTSPTGTSGVRARNGARGREPYRRDVGLDEVVRRRADAQPGEVPGQRDVWHEREGEEQPPRVSLVEVERERRGGHGCSLAAKQRPG